MAVRVFEWRRFGLGIVGFFQERFQAREAGIFPACFTRTFRDVPVHAAHGTEPLTVVTAQRFHREHQVELLMEQLRKIDDPVLVERGVDVFLADLDLFPAR